MMVRIAFYAPLKPPDHPVPSGDRRMARLFIDALRGAGHQPVLASRLRSYDGSGNPERQARLAASGARCAARLLRRFHAAPEAAPQLWFTYHLYHKAPDWLGPAVTTALRIPYVAAEASFAPKQANAGWAQGHQAVEHALRRADAVIGLNPADRACVLPLLRRPDCWMALKPFLDTAAYRPREHSIEGPPRLIAAAMMRSGDKLASYRLLAAAMARLVDLPWSLEVVGDGPARPEVAQALAPLGSRVRWAGSLAPPAVAERLAAADVFVWPAINEAFGMALLEAQASGLPVVAGRVGGVGEIVTHEATGLLVPPGDVIAFATAVRRLLLDPGRCVAFGAAAWRKARREHDITKAAACLGDLVTALGRKRAA